MIIADEPTQGVDVGARVEIYRILREVSASPARRSSSIPRMRSNLKGLCDKVIVLSRGRVVETLTGDDVREERIVAAAVKAATHDDHAEGGQGVARVQEAAGGISAQRTMRRRCRLLAVIVLLAAFGYSPEPALPVAFNISNILLLATALGFIALGQTVRAAAGRDRPFGRAAAGFLAW